MKLSLLITVILAIWGSLASAKDARNDGKDAALKMCSNLSFRSEQNQCLELIKGKDFHPRAVAICGEMNFSSDKFDCLKEIGNKNYTSEEGLKLCEDRPFPSDKVECLAKLDADDEFDNEGDDRDGSRHLRRKAKLALRAVRDREYARAERLLEELNDDLRQRKNVH